MAYEVAIGLKRMALRPGDQGVRVVNSRRRGSFQLRRADKYGMPMGDGQQHETWAEYLRRWANRPGWSVARLARESGIHRATIFRWIAGDGGATVANVRAIAEAVGDDPANALRAAGNTGAARPPAEELDPDLKLILRRLADPDVSEAEKVSIRATLRYLAEVAERTDQDDRPGRTLRRRRRDAS